MILWRKIIALKIGSELMAVEESVVESDNLSRIKPSQRSRHCIGLEDLANDLRIRAPKVLIFH